MSRSALLAACLALAACDQAMADAELGGVTVAGGVLERGRTLYRGQCAVCHGEDGDGEGPAAPGLWPPPRDFRLAAFEFAGTAEQALPADHELARIVRAGLAGTAMRGWDLGDGDLLAVVQYLKTFSPPGQGFRDPRRRAIAPAIPPDPFAADPTAAVREGERLYHSVFQCASCHPAYLDGDAVRALGSEPRATFPFDPVPKWSPSVRTVLLPPDFLRQPLRSVLDRGGEGGHDLEPRDLYRIIAYGLNGPMPSYGHLGVREVWQVAHYVKQLADRRGTDAAAALRAHLLGRSR